MTKRILTMQSTFFLMLSISMSILLSAYGADSKDSRQVILLTDIERNFVLDEMRNYVSGLQRLMDALAQEDMKNVAEITRPLGMQAMKGVPPTLMEKVPGTFKAIGMPTHRAFDEIANTAHTLNSKQVLRQLAAIMRNCVACHATFQIKQVTTK